MEGFEGLREILEANILDWWLALEDPSGGFFGEVDGKGNLHPEAPRGTVLNARILWTMSAAARALGRNDCLEAARREAAYFMDRFLDRDNGGAYWSITSGGEPLETKKQLYAQAFAIYGLSEYFRVSGDPRALAEAVFLFRLVEKHFRDRTFGGYTEALSRDFSPLEDMSLSGHDINAPKTMNSHLHLLEAYANLFSVWPDKALGSASRELLTIFRERITAPDGHLLLYFTDDWTPLPGAVSYGHDIETSWLAMECAEILGDHSPGIVPWCRRLSDAGNSGLLPDGSMMYETLPDGTSDTSRQWWVQAEAVVGNLYLAKYHRIPEGMTNARKLWTFITEHLVDREGGEWYWAVLPDGKADTDSVKAGFWKCPYHNSRMCLEALRLLQ